MAGEHHENFDGTGYPLKLVGNGISLGGRICKITDVFNSLTSQRSYGEVMTPEQALALMQGKLKKQFGIELLTAFFIYVDRQ
jgi:HD-GYP domain-containing protein (c-di-GMP phosphodiesterase class II)